MTAFELNNFESYRDYFENIQTKSTFLDSFHYTKEEFDKASMQDRGEWCFILEPYHTDVADNDADSVLSYPKGMFVICKRKTNELKHFEIEDQAQIYAHKVIGRMRRDRRKSKVLTQFSGFKLQTIKPIGSGGWFGVLVEFNFYYPINKDMKYNEDDWTDDE